MVYTNANSNRIGLREKIMNKELTKGEIMSNTMNIKKEKDHYLFTNSNGQTYHMGLAHYNELGKDEAIKFVESELAKKANNKTYDKPTINFEDARALGFCEYGIKDFCEELNLDIKETYKITDLLHGLTTKVLFSYTDECIQLFGEDKILDKFGGALKLLEDHPTAAARDFVLKSSALTDKQKHTLACLFAKSTLHHFESERPDDKRPRKAIETKVEWIEHYFGPIADKFKDIILHS